MSQSLFSLCIEFVSSNIHLVESFIKFPETIGEIIFQESIRKRQFLNIKNSKEAKANLKVFFDAYGYCGILNSLCLRHCHLFVNDSLNECPWLLKGLNCLDLSFCGLGDDHELLSQLVTSQRLEKLNLQANCLTDDGIRMLTTSLRFHGKNHCLKYLNLSSNAVTTRGLHFLLKCFNRLCAINMTNNNIDNKDHSKFGTSLRPHNTCPCCDSVFDINTDGWATVFMDCWKQEHEKCSNPPKSPVVISASAPCLTLENHPSMDTKTFYRSRKLATETHFVHVKDKENATDKLILVTDNFRCPWNSHEETSHLTHHNLDENSNDATISLPQNRNVLSSHQVDRNQCLSPNRKCNNLSSNSLSVSLAVVNNRRHHLKRKMNNSISQDKRLCVYSCSEMKLSGSDGGDNISQTNQLYDDEKRTGIIPSTADHLGVLAFYTDAEISVTNDRSKGNLTTTKKSLLEELENWT